MPQQPAQSAASHGQDFQTDGRAHEYRHHRGWQSDREFRQRWWHREQGSWSATATSASWASPTPPAARDAPDATAPSAALADPSTPASPRSHTAAINAVATANQLDESATIQLHSADTRIAAYIMSLGPLASARSPSAAVANRYPAARQHVAVMGGRQPTPEPLAALALSPTFTGARRKGILARAVRANGAAATRYVLITHPDAIFDIDRRGSTTLHHAADRGFAALAVLLLTAMADVTARDRDGYTPVDAAEYWAPAPRHDPLNVPPPPPSSSASTEGAPTPPTPPTPLPTPTPTVAQLTKRADRRAASLGPTNKGHHSALHAPFRRIASLRPHSPYRRRRTSAAPRADPYGRLRSDAHCHRPGAARRRSPRLRSHDLTNH